MKNILSSIIAILLITIGLPSFAQSKQTTTYNHGKKMLWNAKPIMVEATNPQTGKIEKREILERGTLIAYDGKKVDKNISKSNLQQIEKAINKGLKSKNIDRPKINGRDVRIHFTNIVINTEGKVAFYEVLIFPYKENIQLYPNEYTTEVKAYLKAVEESINNLSPFKAPSQPLFSEKIIEL